MLKIAFAYLSKANKALDKVQRDAESQAAASVSFHSSHMAGFPEEFLNTLYYQDHNIYSTDTYQQYNAYTVVFSAHPLLALPLHLLNRVNPRSLFPPAEIFSLLLALLLAILISTSAHAPTYYSLQQITLLHLPALTVFVLPAFLSNELTDLAPLFLYDRGRSSNTAYAVLSCPVTPSSLSLPYAP